MRASAGEKWLHALHRTSDTDNKYWPYKADLSALIVSSATAAMECEFIAHRSTHKANHCQARHRVGTTYENFYVLLLADHCTVLEEV